MKRTALFLLSMVLPLAGFAAEPPNPNEEQEKQIYALAREVQAQQAIIVENQEKIDAVLVRVSEAVRVARLFASRGR
jgi:hypothetical protein